MRYKCVLVDQYDYWLTQGKVYEGEVVVSPKEFSGGQFLLLKRADDGYPAYVRVNQFVPHVSKSSDELGV
jgi:hypothetical protein